MTRLTGLGVLLAGALLVAGPQAGARPLLEEIFPDGLPFPFERVLERLTHLAGEDGVQTALIPLGRSLQRYSAAPDYFASPRLIVAVTGDRTGGPDMPRLTGRLYLGFQPAAAAVEAISFDDATGRFVFQEVIDYDAGNGKIENADPQICLRCHQAAGPIFARPLWDETNANRRVATRLSKLGPLYHGAQVRESIDALDAFDAATDGAARIGIANRLWAEGCPDPACRAALFADAVRHGLGAPLVGAAAVAFEKNAASRWPAGLTAVSPDLPNRDPMALLATVEPDALLEPTGPMDPETPRPIMTLWRPGPGSYAAAVREVAALLSARDVSWIEQLLAGAGAGGREKRAPCVRQDVVLDSGAAEIRFTCTLDGIMIGGFVRPDRTGRIELVTGGATRRTAVTAEPAGDTILLHPEGRPPRLPDGRRITSLTLTESALVLGAIADLPALDRALVEKARRDDPVFGPVPFPRRPLLRLIGNVFGSNDG